MTKIDALIGTLQAVGVAAANDNQPRALIFTTRDQIRAVKYLPMLQPVAVISVAELKEIVSVMHRARLMLAGNKARLEKLGAHPFYGTSTSLNELEKYAP